MTKKRKDLEKRKMPDSTHTHARARARTHARTYTHTTTNKQTQRRGQTAKLKQLSKLLGQQETERTSFGQEARSAKIFSGSKLKKYN